MGEINWFDPEDETPSIISSRAVLLAKNGPLAETNPIEDRLMLFETRAGIPFVRSTYPVSDPPVTISGFLDKYALDCLAGKPNLALIQGGLGAPNAVDTLELAIALGCKHLYCFGSCGAIADYLQVGDLIVPTEIEREEGTSYHYAPAGSNATPDAMLGDHLARFLTGKGQSRVFPGKTVTTDGVYRQTLKKERAWRAKGILGVDMEMSALLTVARFYQIPAICLLIVSDKHDLSGRESWRYGGENFSRKREEAIDLFIGFARVHP